MPLVRHKCWIQDPRVCFRSSILPPDIQTPIEGECRTEIRTLTLDLHNGFTSNTQKNIQCTPTQKVRQIHNQEGEMLPKGKVDNGIL